MTASAAPIRRAPPAFRRAVVRRVEPLTPRLMRVTVGGPELAGFTIPEPAASVRLLLPAAGSDELVVPSWRGNEFLLPDGTRPVIRTFTPRRMRADDELDLEIVLHGAGAASTWAAAATPGDPVALSGPGRGYTVDADATAFVLAGDETALPAMCQLLEQLPRATPITVYIEVGHPAAELELSDHPRATLHWRVLPGGAPYGETLLTALASDTADHGTRVWAAGEASGMQRIRKRLFDERGFPRAQATVRGYWKNRVTGDAAHA